MNQYIDKDALLAEIERRLEALANTSAGDNKEFAAIIGAQYYELISLVQYINTLKVKEVDLEEELDNYIDTMEVWEIQEAPLTSIENTAKHFFELGLNTQKGE